MLIINFCVISLSVTYRTNKIIQPRIFESTTERESYSSCGAIQMLQYSVLESFQKIIIGSTTGLTAALPYLISDLLNIGTG